MEVFITKMVLIQMNYLNINKEISIKQSKVILAVKLTLMTQPFINQLISLFQQL
jgi:hypothetical protein